jgi:hypothetical protein
MSTESLSTLPKAGPLGREAACPFVDSAHAFDMADPRLWEGFYDFVGIPHDRRGGVDLWLALARQQGTQGEDEDEQEIAPLWDSPHGFERARRRSP